MSTVKARVDLSQRLVNAFAAQEEVYHIHFFGREAEGCSDRYSDIDMVICSNDLTVTKMTYRDVLSSIAPVRATFCLGGSPHSYSEMVLLEGYSPYHKIDLTIGDNTMVDWPAAVCPISVVYRNQQRERVSRTVLEKVQIEHDVRYVLTDVLFSIARFTKCLFRRDLDMYRRWASISNVTLVTLYEKHFGWEHESTRQKLGSSEIRQLYEDLTSSEIQRVYAICPPSARLDLALSYQTSVDLLIDLSKEKADYFGMALDDGLIGFIQEFMVSEMVRYRQETAV